MRLKLIKKMEKIIVLIYVLIAYINSSQDIKKSYRCGTNNKIIPRKIESISTNKKKALYKRKLDNNNFFDEDKFNIKIETTNIEKEIVIYSLNKYHDIIINSIQNAAETLNSLLRSVDRDCFEFEQDFMDDAGYYYWDRSQFGINSKNTSFFTCDYDIDLLIFYRFMNREDEKDYIDTDIITHIAYLRKDGGQPIIGEIILNKTSINNKRNSFEYWKYYFLHSLTHLLGYNYYMINNHLTNMYILTKNDSYNIQRKYLYSEKLIKVAKKYFNCDNIDGIELEENTESIHWESRILLGEYMCNFGYELDQVISEFTLAYLEDTGYYKANYYTGGKMQYGKNKGCEFIKEKCVKNYEINPKFENEFYDSVMSDNGIDPSCSSGRQSRGYFGMWIRDYIPSYYQYFRRDYIGGYYMADYCPVAQNYYYDVINQHFVGRCDIGTGDYGTGIYYQNNLNYTNGELENITGEKYSPNSFCYLSSLIRDDEKKKSTYSQVARAICYETFCSSKSLTVKIHNNYIVCPRGGGKINAIGFSGYFLCPDYNLICSGTVLCNNIFDCVEKKSKIKEESYIYDYEIKTSQNIEKAEIEDADNENNYELSNDGICIKNCRQCNEKKICINCREDFELVGNKENKELLECKSLEEIQIGYYFDEIESIYYKCDEHCEKCENDKTCYRCEFNFGLVGNKENNEIKCLSLEELKIGYYKGNNLIYYKCTNNCEKCIDNNNCIKCNTKYAKRDNINSTCYLITELKPYYFPDPEDEYNFIKCSDVYSGCSTCDEIKCLDNENKNTNSGYKLSEIIGIIVAVVVGVIIISIVIFCLIKKCHNNSEPGQNRTDERNDVPRSEDTRIENTDRINEIQFVFRTTAGRENTININRNKTMSDLLKVYFQEIGMSKYFGRKELFCFVKDAKKFNFDCQDSVINYYNEIGYNNIVVIDKHNIIL